MCFPESMVKVTSNRGLAFKNCMVINWIVIDHGCVSDSILFFLGDNFDDNRNVDLDVAGG